MQRLAGQERQTQRHLSEASPTPGHEEQTSRSH